MKVECTSMLANELPSELIHPLGIRPGQSFSLVIGKQYTVYGITWHLGHLWYYVCDEDNLYYPVWKPSPLFQIVDNRLSPYWRIGIYTVAQENLKIPIIAFEEWVNDPLYYDRLTEGEEDAVSIFTKYKKLMDDEAIDL